jgi:ABC-type branched-subunit amino acid transport system substrate-binding protein
VSRVVKVGVLYSTKGAYAAVGQDCWDGAHLGLAHGRAAVPAHIDLQVVSADPHSDLSRYMSEALSLLRDHGCRHIIGTITSAARKEIIPLVEKHDALLWYVCPYEGFEANESVIYTGPCPNQHLIPMLDYVMPRFGRRAYLVGANYVWGWETNRLARQLLGESNGEVVGERYLPMDETDVERLITEVRAKAPDFILNNLVGPSSHAFLRAYRKLGEQDARFHPSSRPVVSCNLTECELEDIGHGIAEGNLSAASYFATLDTRENSAFRTAAAQELGHHRAPSTFMATAYATSRIVVEAIAATGTDEPSVIRNFITTRSFNTALGQLAIDSRTNHASLPVHVGRISSLDTFDVVMSHAPLAADPYLAHPQGKSAARPGQDRHLRIVP